MPSPIAILLGIVLPGILIGLIGWIIGRGWVIAPAIAGGFVIAYWQLIGHPALPETSGYQWIMWLAVALGILGLVDALVKPPMWAEALAVFLFWRVAIRLVIGRAVPTGGDHLSQEFWMDLSTLFAVGWYLFFETQARRFGGTSPALVLAIVAVGCGLFAATVFYTLQGALLSLALSAMCAGAALSIRLRKKAMTISSGGTAAIVLILAMVFIFGYFDASDALTSSQNVRMIALTLSPIAAFIGDFPIFQNRPRTRWCVRLAAVALVVGIAAGLSTREYVHGSDQPSVHNSAEE